MLSEKEGEIRSQERVSLRQGPPLTDGRWFRKNLYSQGHQLRIIFIFLPHSNGGGFGW